MTYADTAARNRRSRLVLPPLRTFFHNDTNPWTQQKMPATSHSTASTPRNGAGTAHAPFGTSSATPGRPGPKPGGHRFRPIVDIGSLKIKKDIPLPEHRLNAGKYATYFAQLQPKDCIECKPDEVTAVCNALRKYLRDNDKHEQFVVMSEKNTIEDPSIGHVWMWPKAEVPPEAIPPRSRGGIAVQKKRKAEKK